MKHIVKHSFNVFNLKPNAWIIKKQGNCTVIAINKRDFDRLQKKYEKRMMFYSFNTGLNSFNTNVHLRVNKKELQKDFNLI